MAYQASPKRYEKIPYVRTGKSGLKLPIVSLGLWHNFGGVDSLENAGKILRRAFDLGITHFDLANNYGPPPGSAETNFGKIFKKDFRAHRDELVISTKAGYHMWQGPYGEWGSRKNLLASLDQSLGRMGLPYVDIFYSHRFDPETPLEETMGALHSAVVSGKALYAGISNYPPAETDRACAILKELGTPCLIHQAAYNMLNRKPEDGLLDAVERNGIGLIAFSPLAQGQLTSRYLEGIPKNSRAGKKGTFLKAEAITEDKLKMIRALNDLAEARGQTLARMALAWVLRDKRVTSVLIGASSPAQVDDSLACIENRNFSSEDLAKIDAILKS